LPADPDNPTFRDLFDLNTGIRDRMDQWLEGCADCKRKTGEEIVSIKQRVTAIEGDKAACKANRRSWRDYMVNGGFLVLAVIITFILDHSHVGGT
jgi:hypothetical protein